MKIPDLLNEKLIIMQVISSDILFLAFRQRLELIV